MKTLLLALRNLTRQKKRSFMLAGAVAFGFFVVTVIEGFVAGGVKNLGEQFAYMFGGNVLVERGYVSSDTNFSDNLISSGSEDEKKLKQSVEKIGAKIKYVNKRTLSMGTLIFEGKKTTTNISGCDFDQEMFLKDTVKLVEGSWELAQQKNSLILSEKVAKELKVEIGDSVLFQMSNYLGQANFGEFVIAGISKDISLIGSLFAYCHIDFINELSGLAADDFNTYTLMLENSDLQDSMALALEGDIRKWNSQITSISEAMKSNPASPISALYKQVDEKDWKGTYYTCSSLNLQLPELQSIVSIANLVCVGILIALFLIVMIGISNTYRMVLFERIREIGTMRALGMKQKETGRVFATEAVMLSILGAVLGFVFSLILMAILKNIYISNETMSLFLNNGHITFILSPGIIILELVLVILLTLLAVSGSVKKASKMNPAEALRTVK